ncbi:MAG: hypothetical protein DRQ10_08805 [Candidatus Hydrothermota bacterium]|nr:MAG: hypothetical protein DRQ10_08805 [Candidatus Hydrothermae bacterium]
MPITYIQLTREIEKFIRQKTKPIAWPREFDLNRSIATNIHQVAQSVLHYPTDRYLAVFSVKQTAMNIYDTILIDIDGAELNDSLSKAKSAIAKIESELGIYPTRIYFSGRGFHLYYDFETFILSLADYRAIANTFRKTLRNQPGIDFHVLGDVRRMARIPLTRNSKTDLFMIRIPDLDFPILEYSKNRVQPRLPTDKQNLISHAKLQELIKQSSPSHTHSKPSIKSDTGDVIAGGTYHDLIAVINDNSVLISSYIWNNRDENGRAWPVCIKSYLRELQTTGELDHEKRLELANFLLKIRPRDQVHALFENYANDYNPRITDTQIESILRNKYFHMSCYRKIQTGLCPFKTEDNAKKACPFWPWIDIWITWLDEYVRYAKGGRRP